MYRISVTTLEKFRRVMVGASIYDTEASLIETIKGTFSGNAKTRFGSAYEKIIESPDKCLSIDGYQADNYFFTADQAQPAIDFHTAHPGMVYQVPVTKFYEVDGLSIQVSGKTDAVEATFVRDFKCIFRSIDWQNYIDSYQWRFYLDMIELRTFFYDVFEVQGTEDFGTIRDFSVKPCESLECISYEGMHDDCHSLLLQFMDYIRHRNLYHLLKKAVLPSPIN
jgi:hypothetical protein